MSWFKSYIEVKVMEQIGDLFLLNRYCYTHIVINRNMP